MNTEKLKQNESLRLEFADCLVSDPDFNYSENEFDKWLEELVVPFPETIRKVC